MIIQRVPKWEEISQEKYERIVNKRYSERVARSFVGFTNLTASELSDMFDSDLRREAVFDRPGILSRINGEAKVIGYRYYKKVEHHFACRDAFHFPSSLCFAVFSSMVSRAAGSRLILT